MVEGIIVEMTASEIESLDPHEGFPTWYNRHELDLILYKLLDGKLTEYSVKGQAYI